MLGKQEEMQESIHLNF